jgi:acetyltransferase-like isoleucine patch superfamily enzyme
MVTVRFEDVEANSGRILLKGKRIPDPKIVLCLEEQEGGRVGHNPTKDALLKKIDTLGWSVGNHTYGTPHFFEERMAKFVIGNYCSIASGVKIALGNHRTDTFTTYPFKAFGKYWQNVPRDIDDHSSKGDVIIGSDVWIGTDVFIGSGITIGSGAVLGAKSVIVKDVPPYAIVAGNPGRIIKYRFDSGTIDELLKLSWWDLPEDTVDSLLPLLMSSNASALLDALRRAKAESLERSTATPEAVQES